MARFFKTPSLFRWIFFRRVWGFSSSKKVYLTFDDGPTEKLLPWILDYLKEEKINATFFCVGNNAKVFPELMQRMKNEGHVIGNHTMRHERGTKTSKEVYLKSIKEAEQYTSSTLFRPPYGRMPIHYYGAISKRYKIIMWSWLSYDYDKRVDVSRIIKQAENIKAGDIIVFHDNLKVEERLKEILPEIVSICREKGLEFGLIK